MQLSADWQRRLTALIVRIDRLTIAVCISSIGAMFNSAMWNISGYLIERLIGSIGHDSLPMEQVRFSSEAQRNAHVTPRSDTLLPAAFIMLTGSLMGVSSLWLRLNRSFLHPHISMHGCQVTSSYKPLECCLMDPCLRSSSHDATLHAIALACKAPTSNQGWTLCQAAAPNPPSLITTALGSLRRLLHPSKSGRFRDADVPT